jgi:hypothetical protein
MSATQFISKGNKKLPKTTWILNSGSATDCPSLKLGLCQAGKHCYAMKAEKLYPQTLPYRRRQAELYKTVDPMDFALELIEASNKCRAQKMKCFRFNEAGDFANQEQLDWFAELCFHLNDADVKCYGYTARTDLNLSALLTVAQVNVSNDGHEWTSKGANRFKMVSELSGDNFACPGSCKACSLCLVKRGKTIEILKH